MAKKDKKMVINTRDIKVRRGWGQVKPYSRTHKDKKREAERNACRGKVTEE